MPPTPRIYDFAAAGLAASLSGFELIRMVASHGTSAGHTVLSVVVGGVVFCSVLLIAAVGLALHRRFGWIAGVLAIIAAMSHGIIVRSGGNRVGVLYILGGAAMMALIIKSTHWYRTDEEEARA
jgi:hypothetical protein